MKEKQKRREITIREDHREEKGTVHWPIKAGQHVQKTAERRGTLIRMVRQGDGQVMQPRGRAIGRLYLG